jgi:acyl-coenzyme A thioesterase PaaI-like protein
MNAGSPPLRNLAERGIAFVARSGLRVIHLEPGKATCEMPLEGNQNHMGTLYAGAQFTLADITGGALLLATFGEQEGFPLLKAMDMTFMAPAQSSLHLTLQLTTETITGMRQMLMQKNKADVELEGVLTDRSGTACSSMRGLFQYRLAG